MTIILIIPTISAIDFDIGDPIEVIAGTINIRDMYCTSGTTVIGSRTTGDKGYVMSNQVWCESWYWRKIRWEDGTESWAAQGSGATDWMKKLVVQASNKFAVNDVVKVINTNPIGLSYRSDPTQLGKLGANLDDTQGTVHGQGTIYAVANSTTSGFHHFWRVDYGSGKIGWSAEQFLEKVDGCTNECTNGQYRCNGPNEREQCADWDSDPCYEWQGIQTCLYGCSNGECNDEPPPVNGDDLGNLIDAQAPNYYNSNWVISLEQFKDWIALIAKHEGGEVGYPSHSQAAPGSDLFYHVNAGTSFRFSSGIGPFQLDRGGVGEEWDRMPTIDKINQLKGVQSTMRWHQNNHGNGATLEQFSASSPWYGVKSSEVNIASRWNTLTGLQWNDHKTTKVTNANWASVKSATNILAPNSSYSDNIWNTGPQEWNITLADNVQTARSGGNVTLVFSGQKETYLITVLNGADYDYLYANDPTNEIEYWVYSNKNQPNEFAHMFIRDYSLSAIYPPAGFGNYNTRAMPQHRTSGNSAGFTLTHHAVNLNFCPTPPSQAQSQSQSLQGPTQQSQQSCASDNDNDGHDSATDCNDNDNTIYPGAPETCNNKDDDCDLQIDENVVEAISCGSGSCQGQQERTCSQGQWSGYSPCSTNGNICGTEDCDYLDTTCRNYNDRTRTCSSGTCQTPSCDSYTNEPASTQCGSDYFEYGCPWGTDLDDDTGVRLHDYHCNGQGSCLDFTDPWQVDEICSATENCYWDGIGNGDINYYCAQDVVCINGEKRNCPNQNGVCSGSQETCTNNNWPGCGTSDYNYNFDYETTESTCNDQKDNDCDTYTDNSDSDCAVCQDQDTQQCGQTDEGECQYGLETCAGGQWGTCVGNIDPTSEICDGKDNNCDGNIDETCGLNWSTEVQLTGNQSKPEEIKIITGKGTQDFWKVIVLWTEKNNSPPNEFYYKKSIDFGNTWTRDTKIIRGHSSDMVINGSVIHLVFSDDRNGDNLAEVYYRKSINFGDSWTIDKKLNVGNDDAQLPIISIDNDGLHVVWHDSRNSGIWEIYYKNSPDFGTTWGPDIRLTNNAVASLQPTIGSTNNGLHVTWRQYDPNSHYEVFHKRSLDGGNSWSGNNQFTFGSTNLYNSDLSTNEDYVHIIWDEWEGSVYKVNYLNSFNNGQNWINEISLSSNGASAQEPRISSNINGVHAIWRDFRDGTSKIYYRKGNINGSVWENDLRLSSASQAAIELDIDSNEKGTHVVWTQDKNGDSNREIIYRRILPGCQGGCQLPLPSEPLNFEITNDVDYIRLNWDPPQSDGGTPIIRYHIYRGTTPQNVDLYSQTSLTELNDIVNPGDNYFYKVAAENAIDIGQWTEIKNGTGLYTNNNNIQSGWSLISIPLSHNNNSIESVFSSINGNYQSIFTYDSTNKKWLGFDKDKPKNQNSLINVDFSKSYWVNMINPDTITFSGINIDYMEYNLKQGWNLINYPGQTSINISQALQNVNFVSVLEYNSSKVGNEWKSYDPLKINILNTLNYLTPGYGYWVYLNDDTTWTYENSIFT